MLVNPDAVTDATATIYASAYDTPDAIRAGNGWYQTFGQDIADDRTYAPVKAPLLALTNPGQYDYLREPRCRTRPRTRGSSCSTAPATTSWRNSRTPSSAPDRTPHATVVTDRRDADGGS